MTVKEFDNLLSAAKRGKKIIRKVKQIYYGEDALKETVLYKNYVDFLNLDMDEIVNTNSSINRDSSRVTVFEIEEDTPSNNECPTWCDYNVDGKCEYCGTDARECPRS